VGPLDAVLRLAGDGGDGAEGDSGAWSVHVELTFEAGGEGGQDDAGLAFESCMVVSVLDSCYC